MLLEVLVAILVFSLGVLSLVGLQAASVKQASDAKYRADATMLANDLIGRMWSTNRSQAALEAFETDSDLYDEWQSSISALLPGVEDNPPAVTVAAEGMVTVVISWRAPGDTEDDPHQLTVVTQIK